MSDRQLRALERRWEETGSAEDLSAYLALRFRVGSVDWETYQEPLALPHAIGWLRRRLEEESLNEDDVALGAYCGDAACQQVLSRAQHRPSLLQAWVDGLSELQGDKDSLAGLRCELRAALGALRVLSKVRPDPVAERVLDQVEDFVLQVEGASGSAGLDVVHGQTTEHWIPTSASVVLRGALFAAQAASHLDRYARVLEAHPDAPLLVGYRGGSVFSELSGSATAAALRGSAAAELVPWALGMEPLESRHKADDVLGDVTPYGRRPT